MPKTYKGPYFDIYRYYSDGSKPRLQKRDLTEDQALEWVNDPETSSRTAKKKTKGIQWFDGFVKQQ